MSSDPENESLVTSHKVKWLRPEEISGVGSGAGGLFNGAPSPSNIVQGSLGDCYAVAALSLLAIAGEKHVRRLFVSRGASSDSTSDKDAEYDRSSDRVVVRIFAHGAWKEVSVDSRIACDPSSKQPIFVKSRSVGHRCSRKYLHMWSSTCTCAFRR